MSEVQEQPRMMMAALYYARMGWPVFPLRPRSKVPLTPHGVKDASTDEEQITAWWTQWPDANIALACGHVGCTSVLDLDSAEAEAKIRDLQEEHGWLPRTMVSRTARGRHLFFAFDPHIKNGSKLLGTAADTRSEGGYVCLPPSVHPSGAVYAWEVGHAPNDSQELPPWPEWLVERLLERRREAPKPPPIRGSSSDTQRYCRTAFEAECRELRDAAEGERNNAANRAAYNLGGLVWTGHLYEDEVSLALLAACHANGLVHSDGERAVRATIASGLKAGQEAPRDIPPPFQRDVSPQNVPQEPQAAEQKPTATAPSPADVVRAWQAAGPLVHEATGLLELDRVTDGGPVYGTRWYIQGAPDAGKTALLLQIAHSYAERGIHVALLAVDEEPDDIVTRLAQRVGYSRQACEVRHPAELERMAQDIGGLPIRIYDSSWTIERVAADLTAWSGGKPAILCIDSLQTVQCDLEVMAGEMSMPMAIKARVAAIRACAIRYRLIALTTSEMARAAYRSKSQRDNIDPLAAGKWSGDIEYAARVLISLRSVPDSANLIELEIPKSKQGLGRRLASEENAIYLAIDRATQRMFETPPPSKATDDEDDSGDAKLDKLCGDLTVALLRSKVAITSRSELVGLVRGRRSDVEAAVTKLRTSGRLAGGKGSPFRVVQGAEEAG